MTAVLARTMKCERASDHERARGSILIVSMTVFALFPALLSAQSLPLKTPPPAEVPISTCPAVELPVSGAAVTPLVIDSLVNAGVQAGLRGDHIGARLLYRQASFLDPANPIIPYRLGVTLEELDEPDSARIEYCRYLALDPSAADALEVADRVRRLAEESVAADEPWRQAVTEGVAAFDAARYADAAAAFTRAINVQPDYADGYYNRAVTRIVSGANAEASADLARYLEMEPLAADAGAVRAQLNALRPTIAVATPSEPSPAAPPASPSQPAFREIQPDIRIPPAPGSVFARGVVVPGLGQYSTGRPVLGTLVLGAAAGAVWFGLQEEIGVERRSSTDPFGNAYSYNVSVNERPNFMVGVGAAAGIALIGAIESALHARSVRAAYGATTPADGHPRLAVTTNARGAVSLAIGIGVESLRIR